ncbi:TlpA family protein disulfide reductase [Gammaproteobacteria bacterium]|nr:TlpA family protein disulfide reductase [Gammaproteobacteria bacterium]
MKSFFIFIGLIIISSVLFLQFQEPEDQTIVMSEFSLENINGEMISIEKFKGKKTLINFWATWCRPCRKEMPMLNGVYLSENPSEFSVVGIAIDKPEKVAQFVAELGIDFPIMIGQSNAYDIMKELGNEALTLPYTILIDDTDEVIWSKNTELKHSDMDEVLNIK